MPTLLLPFYASNLRSAAAANKLDVSGFQNIACITSGLQSVKPGYNSTTNGPMLTSPDSAQPG